MSVAATIDSNGPAAATVVGPSGKPVPPQLLANQWRPGQSGNPTGRARSIEAYIREQTKNGHEIVDFMLAVMRGEERHFAKMDHRMSAARWLADRGFGAVQPAVDLGNNGETRPLLDMSRLTPEQLAEANAIRERVAALMKVAAGVVDATPAPVADGAAKSEPVAIAGTGAPQVVPSTAPVAPPAAGAA